MEILPALFGEIVVETSVFEELLALKWQEDALQSATWLSVQLATNHPLVADLSQTLDLGEAASIALALEIQADYLLIDERRGRKVAAELGLQITGLLGVLLLAKSRGVIEQIRPILDQMVVQNGFRLQESLYNEVLRQAGEI